MNYIVAYDIRDNRRRTKVLSILKNYGFPAQLSVVECELTEMQRRKLLERLSPLLSKNDKLTLYPLCERCFVRVEKAPSRPNVSKSRKNQGLTPKAARKGKTGGSARDTENSAS